MTIEQKFTKECESNYHYSEENYSGNGSFGDKGEGKGGEFVRESLFFKESERAGEARRKLCEGLVLPADKFLIAGRLLAAGYDRAANA